MLLKEAFRVGQTDQIAIVGAGGKTSTMFMLARELNSRAILTTSTHLSIGQARLADDAHVVRNVPDILAILSETPKQNNVVLFTGPPGEHGRLDSLDMETLNVLSQYCRQSATPLLIEADGSKCRPLKAPGENEPPIPNWVDKVIVVVGLSGVGKQATEDVIHRPEVFCKLAGINLMDRVTPAAIATVLTHPDGGLKNIPDRAHKCILLNQADNAHLEKAAEEIVGRVSGYFDTVATSKLLNDRQEPMLSPVKTRSEPIAGVVLAAGGASRYGTQKLLVDWFGKPLIQHVVEVVASSGLMPVVVVAGEEAQEIRNIVVAPKVLIVDNPTWWEGQSTSVIQGLRAINAYTGGAIFFLGDQPAISKTLIHHLIEVKKTDNHKIIAPAIKGKRVTPTLFDRDLFEQLLTITGDEGGRQLFDNYSPHLVDWDDRRLMEDIDTTDDYRRLRRLYE
ncbi:MAG: putative selenium-dependent hydroxylase accessory protein YqeC [Anaerolineae bacterium]|nr:putative selenium-dependent hydroxylase accessory protein YqeC [Anaerolineae bacterium]